MEAAGPFTVSRRRLIGWSEIKDDFRISPPPTGWEAHTATGMASMALTHGNNNNWQEPKLRTSKQLQGKYNMPAVRFGSYEYLKFTDQPMSDRSPLPKFA